LKPDNLRGDQPAGNQEQEIASSALPAPNHRLSLVKGDAPSYRIVLISSGPERLHITEMLQSMPLEITRIPPGDDTADAIKYADPQVIIMDWSPPGPASVQLYTQLRDLYPTIPILIIAPDRSIEPEVRQCLLGIDEYIVPPVQKDDLVSRLKLLLRLKPLQERLVKLEELSIRDDLTGLFNRRYFLEQLSHHILNIARYGGSFYCILLDIDYFKLINDAYGHQFGDHVLRELGDQLLSFMRKTDLVARYGGDEFIILLTNIAHDTLVGFTERIRLKIENQVIEENGKATKITVSMGVAAFPLKGISSRDQVIQCADAALYKAKNDGRNQICYGCAPELSNPPPMNMAHLLKNDGEINDIKKQFYALSRKMKETYIDSTRALAMAVEAKDYYTREHSSNVANYAVEIAGHLGLPDETIEVVRNASILHDIGKIGISENILLKPSKLSDDEYKIMKEHPIIGANIIRPMRFLEEELILIRHHHERYDGNGYPDGLAGEEIPLGSRIIGVADAYEAMTSDRSYRDAYSHDEAMAELVSASSRQFDPKVVEAFQEVLRRHKARQAPQDLRPLHPLGEEDIE